MPVYYIREVFVDLKKVAVVEKGGAYPRNQVDFYDSNTMNGEGTMIFIAGYDFEVLESLDYILQKIG